MCISENLQNNIDSTIVLDDTFTMFPILPTFLQKGRGLRYPPPCTSYEEFESLFLKVLSKHAPMKSKYIRANEAPYMTRCLKKAIMKRSHLESKYYKTKSDIDKALYKTYKLC